MALQLHESSSFDITEGVYLCLHVAVVTLVTAGYQGSIALCSPHHITMSAYNYNGNYPQQQQQQSYGGYPQQQQQQPYAGYPQQQQQQQQYGGYPQQQQQYGGGYPQQQQQYGGGYYTQDQQQQQQQPPSYDDNFTVDKDGRVVAVEGGSSGAGSWRSPLEEARQKQETDQFSGFSDKAVRSAFLQKVYAILMCQLLVTGAIMATIMFVQPIRE